MIAMGRRLSRQRPKLVHAWRMTAAALATFALAVALGPPQGFWAVVTALIVTQGNVGGSLKAAGERFAESVFGAVYGGAVAFVIPHGDVLGRAVALVVAVAPLSVLAAASAGFRVAPITAIIVLLGIAGATLGPLEFAIERIVEVGPRLRGRVAGLGPGRAGPGVARGPGNGGRGRAAAGRSARRAGVARRRPGPSRSRRPGDEDPSGPQPARNLGRRGGARAAEPPGGGGARPRTPVSDPAQVAPRSGHAPARHPRTRRRRGGARAVGPALAPALGACRAGRGRGPARRRRGPGRAPGTGGGGRAGRGRRRLQGRPRRDAPARPGAPVLERRGRPDVRRGLRARPVPARPGRPDQTGQGARRPGRGGRGG